MLAFILVLLVAGSLFVWPGAPSMLRLRAFLLRQPPPHPADGEQLKLHTILTASAHFALLAFVVCSSTEFVHLKGLKARDIVAFSTAVGLAAMVTLVAIARDAVPTRWLPAGIAAERRLALSGVAIVLITAAAAFMLWPMGGEFACRECEPGMWMQGVSAWPSHLVHVVALVVVVWGLDVLWTRVRRAREEDARWLTCQEPPTEGPAPPWWRSSWRWWQSRTLLLWRQEPVAGGVDFHVLWTAYQQRGAGPARAMRVLFWWVVTVAAVGAIYFAFSDGFRPAVPVRGTEHRQLIAGTFFALLLLLPLLIVAVADATMLACRFTWHLNKGRSVHSEQTIARFADELGPTHAELWKRRIAGDTGRRLDAAPQEQRHTLLDDWIDVQVVARRTALVAPLVIWPFVVLALMVVARSRLLDAWALTMPIALGVALYCLWLVLLAYLLKHAAEQTRERAVRRMRSDLRWIAGAGPEYTGLVAPYERLISAVEGNREGAFASFFDQPLLKGLLVPLGGVGGTQLFDRLLLSH